MSVTPANRFQPAPIPAEEAARVAALTRTRALEVKRDSALDKITRTAAHLFGVPYSLLSLVDREEQVFKSTCGIKLDSTGRDVSFCGHTILCSEPLIVPDTFLDDRFADNPLVQGAPGIRFYAGAPLHTADGHRIGSLCVFDTEPHPQPSAEQIAVLSDLADVAMAQFDLRLAYFHMARQDETLRQSERLAALALRSGGMGVWRMDSTHDRVYWSPEMEVIFGMGVPAGASGLFWFRSVHKDDRRTVAAHFRGLHCKASFQERLRIVRPDGSVRWIAIAGAIQRDSKNRIIGAVGVCQDATDQQQTLQALRESEQTFRMLSHASPLGIFRIREDMSLAYANPKLLEIWQMSDIELLSAQWRDHVHQDDWPQAVAHFESLRRHDHPIPLRFRIVRPDGDLRWLESHAAPLFDADGKFRGAISTTADVTEQRRALEFLEAAKNAAESANRSKDVFVGNVSHELRTPLNGILGTAELLLQSDLSQEGRELTQVIQDAGHSLLSLVNDILDMRRIENGLLVLEEVPLSLPQVIQQAMANVEAAARRKSLNLHFAYPHAFPAHFLGDPTRIRQILTNYLSNAVKFTAAGSVTVSVEDEGRSFQKLRLRLSVRDTGPGIAAVAQAKLFQPFSQVDSSSTREHGGIGLGLAICKHVAELMGGSVGVESEPGQGATFFLRLSLPRCKTTVSSPAPAINSGRSNAGEKGRLLVAEDNPVNQKVAVRMLQKMGWHVDVAGNGREAVALVQANRYSLVLMDCQMPELDGYGAAAEIRAFEEADRTEKRRTPIVALTAHAMNGDREACLRAGMDDYLAKPFQMDHLHAMVDRWAAPPVNGPALPEPTLPEPANV